MGTEQMKKELEQELLTHILPFWADKMDSEWGGFYGFMDYQGRPADTIKHSYNIGFGVYALASYYDASKDEEALFLALALFELLEEKYRDEYGYQEALTVDFQPQSNEHLSLGIHKELSHRCTGWRGMDQ